MSVFTVFDVSASGMAVQRQRIDIISENLANVSSTRTPEGGPYKKRNVIVTSVPLSFDASLGGYLKADDVHAAAVMGVTKSTKPPKNVFDPSHPDADEKGFVAYPNINGTHEMVDMMTASRAYQANITVLNAAKAMVMRTFEIGVG